MLLFFTKHPKALAFLSTNVCEPSTLAVLLLFWFVFFFFKNKKLSQGLLHFTAHKWHEHSDKHIIPLSSGGEKL